MKKYLKYVFFVWVLFVWVFLYFFYSFKNFESETYNINEINIEKWDTWKKVIKKLCKKIWNCLNLTIYSKLHDIDDIKSWVYTFSWKTINWIFKQFKKWPSFYLKFTILPGETKFDIEKKLEKISSKKIADKFLKLVDDKEFIQKLNYKFFKYFSNIKSLEGFLYPDTYFFKSSDLSSILFPELLIKTVLKNFQTKWSSIKCDTNCNPYHLTKYENLIISSIVEKEAINSKNKPLIADILIRRYLNNWKIWADWTLCYGLKISSYECKNYLYNKYLNDSSNFYNTRVNISLPPTPVSNPTINTMKSTLFLKKNKYWYYLHDKKGNIHFSKNLKQHNYYKNKYLR